MATFQILIKGGWGVQIYAMSTSHSHHQQMLLIRYAKLPRS